MPLRFDVSWGAMSLDTVIPAAAGWALFLDVDGTLLEIAETPDAVKVPPRLKDLLTEVAVRVDGAIALVTGRTLADLDRLFTPLRLCAAGGHGSEYREATGCVVRPPFQSGFLDGAREELMRFVRLREGLLLEDKGYGLAVHFRRAPHLAPDVLDVMRRQRHALGASVALQAGKCVFELRPAGMTKGTAIATFLRQQPFLQRTPVFVGDDLTDEHAFAVVNDYGGLSIKVGDGLQTLAKHRLGGVADVLRWLERFPASTEYV